MIIIHSYEIRWLGSYTTWIVMAFNGIVDGISNGIYIYNGKLVGNMGMDGWTDGRTER
jgi:hypothetical protein